VAIGNQLFLQALDLVGSAFARQFERVQADLGGGLFGARLAPDPVDEIAADFLQTDFVRCQVFSQLLDLGECE
jgi:hypothetical protein